MNPPCDRARSRLRWVVLIAFSVSWIGAFVVTHLPPEDVSGIHMSDKTAHGIGYGVLAILLFGTLLAFDRARLSRLGLTLGILLAYGALDELTQPMFGRFASLHDWFADAVGVVIGLTLWETVLFLSGVLGRRKSEA